MRILRILAIRQQQSDSMADMHLSTNLHVIRMVDDCITPQAAANQFDVTVENVMSIMQTRKQVESLEKSHTNRNYICFGDKLRVLNLLKIQKNQAQVARICNTHRETVKNVLDSRESIHSAEISGTHITVKRLLRAVHPAIDNTRIEFINFARSKRIPVTSSHIKSCAEQAAKRYKIVLSCI